MPHLTIEYTANLEALTDIGALCKRLSATLVALQGDDRGDGLADGPLFPVAGTRVMARPALHCAVADGHPDRAFMYLKLRITPGRSPALIQRAGDALLASASAQLDTLFAQQALGLTLHIDEGQPVYEGKRNNLAGHLQK